MLTPSEQEFQAWRRKQRANRFAMIVTAGIGLAMLAGTAVLYFREVAGDELPTVEEIEKRLKVWAGKEADGILEGRPLRCIPFYLNAATEYPVFRLWVNKDGKRVGLSCESMAEPRGLTRAEFDKWIAKYPEVLKTDAWMAGKAWELFDKEFGCGDGVEVGRELTKSEIVTGTDKFGRTIRIGKAKSGGKTVFRECKDDMSADKMARLPSSVCFSAIVDRYW